MEPSKSQMPTFGAHLAASRPQDLQRSVMSRKQFRVESTAAVRHGESGDSACRFQVIWQALSPDMDSTWYSRALLIKQRRLRGLSHKDLGRVRDRQRKQRPERQKLSELPWRNLRTKIVLKRGFMKHGAPCSPHLVTTSPLWICMKRTISVESGRAQHQLCSILTYSRMILPRYGRCRRAAHQLVQPPLCGCAIQRHLFRYNDKLRAGGRLRLVPPAEVHDRRRDRILQDGCCLAQLRGSERWLQRRCGGLCIPVRSGC